MKLLEQLSKAVKKHGISQASVDMGYRANSTILRWIRTKKIPASAIVKVENYLKYKGK